MKTFVSFVIEANLGICFFLLVYQTLLKKETNHRFNRGYLLFALAIPITLPFFHFQISPPLTFNKAMPTHWLPEIQITSLPNYPMAQFDSFWFWVYAIYVTGTTIFFTVFLIRLLRIVIAIYQSPRFKNGSAWVIELIGDQEVFSFFKFIFVSKSLRLTKSEKRQIIRHEHVHISHYHSFDILFVNLIGVLFWFNPLVKTYRKSFIQLHEFEADARAVEGYDANEYCGLLAKAVLNSSGYQLANHFTNSLTLRRIEMMKTTKTKISNWKVISIVAAAIAFCFVVGCSSTDEVYDQVDELPTFGKGPQYTELFEFFAHNLRYPKEAAKKGIEGKVYIKFVVEKDGTVTHVSAEKGIGYGCDEAAVQVVKRLPPWNPGKKGDKIVRTSFVLPICFQLPVTKRGK